MTLADDGLRFWLDYVDAAGGLWEETGDSAVVVLPETLQQEHGGADQLTVTSDPDVARDDGAVLLAAGHPFLTHAAEAVLGDGDCGVARLPKSTSVRPPSTDQLLAWAREQFPVDHGKIDTTTGASPALRHVLRVGALASYAVSDDDHFQEQVERWVDVPSRLTLSEPVVARLSRLACDDRRGGDTAMPPTAELTAALAYAHEQIAVRTREREAELSTQLGDACDRETQRAVTYYGEVLRSLQRRLDTAPPERAGTLSARMSSTRAERDRRLAEIAEKYRPHTTVRPFRLHVVGVPVMRLPVDVRRGERRFPLTLDWLMPARTFAGQRCPHCASTEPLVAAKTRLGCRQCLAKPKPPPAGPARAPSPAPPAAADAGPPPAAVPASTHARPKRAEGTARKPDPSSRSRAARVHAPATPKLSPRVIQKAGHKLLTSLWDMTVAADRRVRRMDAPDSPAGAMHKLFGPAGALRAVGVDLDEEPRAAYDSESEPAPGDADRFLIAGELSCDRLSYRFQLCWRLHESTPLIEEITPFATAQWPQLLDLGSKLGHFGFAFMHPNPGLLHATEPSPSVQLDPVARALWSRGMPVHGLPLVLRCLAAWWRLTDRDQLMDAHPRSVLAAAIDRMVAYRAGATRGSRYSDAAQTYQVGADSVREVSTGLQRMLRLSPTRPW